MPPYKQILSYYIKVFHNFFNTFLVGIINICISHFFFSYLQYVKINMKESNIFYVTYTQNNYFYRIRIYVLDSIVKKNSANYDPIIYFLKIIPRDKYNQVYWRVAIISQGISNDYFYFLCEELFILLQSLLTMSLQNLS